MRRWEASWPLGDAGTNCPRVPLPNVENMAVVVMSVGTVDKRARFHT